MGKTNVRPDGGDDMFNRRTMNDDEIERLHKLLDPLVDGFNRGSYDPVEGDEDDFFDPR